MPSAFRTAIVALSLMVVAGAAPADPVMEIIDLRYLQAAPLAASFAPAEQTAADDDLFRQRVATDFALGAIARVAALRPGPGAQSREPAVLRRYLEPVVEPRSAGG